MLKFVSGTKENACVQIVATGPAPPVNAFRVIVWDREGRDLIDLGQELLRRQRQFDK